MMAILHATIRVLQDIHNRRDVEFLVESFYQRALKDDVIGHFFTKVVVIVWEEHIPVICDFWDSMLLGAGNFRGNPMVKHIAMSKKAYVGPEHLKRWIGLWSGTVRMNYKGVNADKAIEKANQIGELMLYKIEQDRKFDV